MIYRHALSMCILPHCKIRLGAVLLLLALMPLGQVSRAQGTASGSFEISISGLRDLDQTLASIKAKGVGEWLSATARRASRENFPSLFGARAKSVDRVVQAGDHVYTLQSRGFDTIRNMQSARSSAEVEQTSNEFWSWIRGEKLPALSTDILPSRVRSAVDSAGRVRDNAAWVAERGEQAVDAAASVASRVSAYFSETTGYGLEPGARKSEVVAVERGADRSPIAPDAASIDSAEAWVARNRRAENAPGVITRAAMDATQARAPLKGPSETDIAALERDLGVRSSSGLKSTTEIDTLAASLGVVSKPPARGSSKWAEEARIARTAVENWEVEEARKAEAQSRMREAQQKQEARERERARHAVEKQALRLQTESEVSVPARANEPKESSSYSIGSFLGDVMGEVGRTYLRQKYGTSPVPGPVARAPRSTPPSTAERGQGANVECSGASTAVLACQRQIENVKGICETNRATAVCMASVEQRFRSCSEVATTAREIRLQALDGAGGICSNCNSRAECARVWGVSSR